MSARDAFDTLCQIGLEPLLKVAREKIRRDDGVGGTIQVPLSQRQRDELAGLIRVPPSRGAMVRVDLLRLDEGLRASGFQISLVQVLAAGYGPLISRREEREREQAAWQQWLDHLQQQLPAAAINWFTGIVTGETASGRWVRRGYGDSAERTRQAIATVGQALASLPVDSGQHEMAAVFAARLTGDPHAFDSGTPVGRLFELALSERFHPPEEGLTDRERRAFLLDMAGLGVDQVSSTVLVAHLAGASLTSGDHPVVESMAAYGGAWRITLGELGSWQGARARNGRAYVVENPPVFEHLLHGLSCLQAEQRPTLICTEGFLSAAAIKLLNFLDSEGTEIWYGGDFDHNGLVIAHWVGSRYGNRWRPWRMGVEDYWAAHLQGAARLEAAMRAKLLGLEGPLGPTAKAVAEGGYAYQERLVEVLLGDLRR